MFEYWYTHMEGANLHYTTHFLAGFFVAVVIARFTDPLIGLAAGIVAALGKELMDKLSGMGTPEKKAAVLTMAGALLAAIIMA